jgi:hypothetical protein
MALTVGTNSYVTLTEADAYIADKLHAAEWDSAIVITREKSLKEACRRINRLAFKGQKFSNTQLLAFRG